MGLGRPALALVVAAARGHALCWTAEQPNCDYALATLATKPTLRELELFLRTLHRFDATTGRLGPGEINLNITSGRLILRCE